MTAVSEKPKVVIADDQYVARGFFEMYVKMSADYELAASLATAEQAGTEKDPTTTYMFNPVKIDDKWLLCVKTLNDEIDYYKSFE